MSIAVQTINGTECIGDSLPKINSNFSELAKFVAPSFSSADLAAISSNANTANKEMGRVVYDTINHRLMVASGPLANSPWYTVDGSTSVTPA